MHQFQSEWDQTDIQIAAILPQLSKSSLSFSGQKSRSGFFKASFNNHLATINLINTIHINLLAIGLIVIRSIEISNAVI